MNVPLVFVQVTRAGKTDDYVDARGSCWSTGTPITTTTMNKLLRAVEGLGEP
jgi:hypothetical protein